MSKPRVNCPTCHRQVAWEDAPFRPFCSERCRLLDLGSWLSEQRSLPAEAVEVNSDDPATPEPAPRRKERQ